jgi:dipeptidyl-peptidase-4
MIMGKSSRFLAFWLLCVYLGELANAQTAPTPITLDHILNGNYSASGFSGTWISDEELIYNSGANILSFNATSKTSSVYLNGTVFNQTQFPGRTLTYSTDKNFILIQHSRKSLWRHSFLAKYELYNRNTQQVTKLNPPGHPAGQHAELQLVRWSPANNNALVFVYANNIYYRASAGDETTAQVTTSGSLNGPISNGHTDWVYEEEMFGSGSAIWWSPTGSHFAFVEFDDTEVSEFEYPMYGEPGNRETVYPELINIRYPKSGQTNPKTKVFTVALNGMTPVELQYPATDDPDRDRHYIATAAWKSETDFVVVHLNRRQQRARWYNCKAPVGSGFTCELVYLEIEEAGWIDVSSPRFSSDGTQMLTLSSDRLTGNYRHIIKFNFTGLPQHLNTGNFHVDAILGWDLATQTIYFSGASTGSPSEAQIYKAVGTGLTPTVTCLTCTLTNGNEELCRQNSGSFSTQFKYFLHSCSGPGIPETAFRTTANVETVQYVWTNNSALREALKTKRVPQIQEFLNIPLAGGAIGRAKLFLPADFNEARKYPLLIDVYAGPDSQNVRYGFGFNWGTSLVSDKEIIYGYIDGRGSGRQTRAHLFALTNKLGSVEIEDQIAAVKYLIAETKYIDPNRTAIWGWSYGGYATAMVMAKDTEGIFKCGISVAPVTSWLYYDTIYTERYMGTPSENSLNYNLSEVTTQVENFRTKQFFLVHGNADDNVHYQQSMILSRALEKADIMFNQLSYPDEDHSIAGPNMRRHLYHSLDKFLFRDCFAGAEGPPPTQNNSAQNISTISSFIALVAAALFAIQIFHH